MKQWQEIFKQLTLLTQFGLSLLTPTLLCLGICYLLTTRLHAGLWVYLPGFFFGLGGSAATAMKFYRAVMRSGDKEKKSREKTISFNRHL